MIEIHLTEQEIQNLNESIDDPTHSEKTKIKLLVIRMRHEGTRRALSPRVSTSMATWSLATSTSFSSKNHQPPWEIDTINLLVR